MALFFHMQSHFDWSRYCWCIEGARRLDTLHSNSANDAVEYGDSYGAEAFGGLAGSPAPLLLSQASATLSHEAIGVGLRVVKCSTREGVWGQGVLVIKCFFFLAVFGVCREFFLHDMEAALCRGNRSVKSCPPAQSTPVTVYIPK